MPVSQAHGGDLEYTWRFVWLFLKEKAIFGHCAEPCVDWRSEGGGDQFPIPDTDWRIEGEAGAESYRFLGEAEAPFSVESVHQAAVAGTRLESNFADIRHSGRQAQEIRTKEIASLAQNAMVMLVGEPYLREQIARIREAGSAPYYGGPSRGNGRLSWIPNDESKTHPVVSKIWGCGKETRAFGACRFNQF